MVIIDNRELKTLNDFQKLLGDINWLWQALGIPMANLQTWLTYSKLSSFEFPRQLSAEETKELCLVENVLNTWYLNRLYPQHSLQLFLFPTRHSPTGPIRQLIPELRFIEWSFHSHSPSKTVSPHLDFICSLILDGKLWHAKLTGQNPEVTRLPLTKTQFEKALHFHRFTSHPADSLPTAKTLHSLSHTKIIYHTEIVHIPLPRALIVSTDGSGKTEERPFTSHLMGPFNEGASHQLSELKLGHWF